MSFTINHLLHINAPLNKVFNAITNIEELKLWYTTEVQGGSKLNEIIEFKFGGVDFVGEEPDDEGEAEEEGKAHVLPQPRTLSGLPRLESEGRSKLFVVFSKKNNNK